jgi:hypothetical protein
MKKALIILSTASAFAYNALAQVQINIGGGAAGGATGAGSQAGSSLLNLLALAQTLVIRLVPFFIGLAVVVFFWYLIEFIWKGREDGAKRTEGLKGMGYAVLALFVMVSIWGLVGFLGSFFGIGQGGSVPAPGIPLPQ